MNLEHTGSRSVLRSLSVFNVFESDLASVADLDVDHVPPAICDLAVVADVELNSVLAHAVKRDLRAQRVTRSGAASASAYLGVAFLHEAAAERVYFVPGAG